ncbi:hypothetical protein [Mangrovibacterium sp.]|uniref:hypothetical protein n=1 Tax=Mangrovibacterium sp. TaxID=1961364 RepID=UPI00356A09A8
MKNYKNILALLFITLFAFSCTTDEDKFYSLDYIQAPSNVDAVFDITQDNTGLVTIVPNAEGATRFNIDFGDGTDSGEITGQSSVTHTYTEGVYSVVIAATGITDLTTEATKELNVTFKAPEDLVVTITKNAANPKIVSISATATYATIIDIYFGDVEDEEATHILPGETATNTYAEPGDYIVKVIAKSAGAATTEYTETLTIDAASDPINLPIDFESYLVNYAFGDFGGLSSSVIDNPDATGVNTSSRVAQAVKASGAETWAGTALTLENPIDFSTKTLFKVKVWSPKSGAVVKLKFENLTDGSIASEVDATTTVANAWEELEFNFSSIDVANEYQKVVLFFDFGNVGDGSTYYFDGVKQVTPPTEVSPLAGTWVMAPVADAFSVGPVEGEYWWWGNSVDDVTLRACYFDDTYTFGTDGSFSNDLGGESWIEGWQGGNDACGTPVAPHDGTAMATYAYDEAAGTLTIDGKGAYLGLAKVYNGGELLSPDDAVSSITYKATLSDDNSALTLVIEVDGGWWRFQLVKSSDVVVSPLAGTWQMAPEADALGVGPSLGDLSYWSNSVDDVTTRACFFDDTYVFGNDGSFSNVLGDDTWVEAWQGGSDACGTPVAPHDGTAAATFTYDAVAGTVTLDGKGAYLGIPKAYNGGELKDPANAPESITYDIELSEGNTVMILDIEVLGAWWRYKLVKN